MYKMKKMRVAPLLSLVIFSFSSVCAYCKGIAQDKSLIEFSGVAIKTLQKGDFANFDRLISINGLIFSKREIDWDKTKNNLDNTPNYKKTEKYVMDLKLSGDDFLVWEEKELRYSRSEVNSRPFVDKLKSFQNFIQNSSDGYKSSIITSNNTQDAWGSRYLGPSVNGKIASNTFWYIYFKRENNQWKVWRLELASH